MIDEFGRSSIKLPRPADSVRLVTIDTMESWYLLGAYLGTVGN